jgi:steroid delta-isomerase-like uncharacterized protein
MLVPKLARRKPRPAVQSQGKIVPTADQRKARPAPRRIMGKTSLLLFVVLGAVGAAFAVDSAPKPDGTSQEARNRAVARRVFEEIFNQGKFQVADEIYASDFVNHGLHRNFDLQEDQAAVHAEKKAFPDLKITVDLMVAEADLVTVVWTFRGTNTAAGYGLPPTGARIELRGITVWRIVDGKIREEWTSFDCKPPANW